MKHIVTTITPVAAVKIVPVDWKYTKVTLDAQQKEVSRVPQPEEFHAIVDDAYDHTGTTYCAQWDGKSDTLTVLVGDSKTLTHRFLGWPQ